MDEPSTPGIRNADNPLGEEIIIARAWPCSDAIHNQEAVRALEAIKGGDKESAHIEADNALMKFLVDTGNEDVARAWEATKERVGGFWYA